jgi:hypothetical protein
MGKTEKAEAEKTMSGAKRSAIYVRVVVRQNLTKLARACFRVVCQPTGSLLRPMLLQPTGSARGESVRRGSELGQRELLR